MSAPTPTELRATLVTLIAGATDTRTQEWEDLLGPVETLPIVSSPRCNWRVAIGEGPAKDREVIEKAIELLRREHPHVSAERSPGA